MFKAVHESLESEVESERVERVMMKVEEWVKKIVLVKLEMAEQKLWGNERPVVV